MSEERIARLQADIDTLGKNCEMLHKAITDRDEGMIELCHAIGDRIDKACDPLKARITELEFELKENPPFKFLGVWNFEATYHKNNSVSYQGSMWICVGQSTKDVPGGSEGTWLLAVKRGKDSAKESKHYALA